MTEAERLADLFELEQDPESLYRVAAAELRRLQAEVEALRTAAKVAAHAAAYEREQCALVCDDISDSAWALWKIGYDPLEQGRNVGADHCAAAIRARK